MAGCECVRFADDIVILARDGDPYNALNRLQKIVDRVSDYLSVRNLRISASETKLMVFTRNRSPVENSFIRVETQFVYPANMVKFLGIVLDPKLSGKKHAEYIEKGTEGCDAGEILVRNLVEFLSFYIDGFVWIVISRLDGIWCVSISVT